MKRRLVAVTLSLIMTMATVSEAGAAAFTSPDTAPAVATQTDAEEVNVTEETSETEADAFSDGDDGTAVPSQEQTDDAFTAGTDTAAALPDETPSTADATDAVGAAVVKAEDWVSTDHFCSHAASLIYDLLNIFIWNMRKNISKLICNIQSHGNLCQ